jgi:hypothetical protein
MSTNFVSTAALVLTLFSFGAAQAQGPYAMTPPVQAEPTYGNGSEEKAPPSMEPPHTLSHYITGRKCDCCGPVGGDGPLFSELYVRGGLSFPMGGNALARSLDAPGWMIEGGGRLLLFDPSMNGAWAIDLGLSNTWNSAHAPKIHIPISVLVPNALGTPTLVNFGTDTGVPGVTVNTLNQTYVNVGVGRECYLLDPANAAGARWRVGLDLGGRYGVEELGLNEIRHRVDTVAGVYAAIHSDVEIPCCSVVFVAGIRGEYSYTWSDILQHQNDSDLQQINLLFTAGVRF